MNGELAHLHAEVARQRAEIDALAAELEETNRGVVALYAELDDNAQRLREANDLKSRFLSYMSHEFRTPLASLHSLSDILLSGLDGPLTAEQGRQLLFMQDSVRELSDMVDDLLDLAKIEAGRITISPAWFEMVDLFAALRGMFRPIVRNSAVSLIFEEPPPLPRLYSDDRKVAQILRNFISNGLKFTNVGEVRVSAREIEPGVVQFSVSDTGMGIESHHLAALFSDFVQLDTRVQRRLRGSGLGLALARKFAELLGGWVGVESTVNVGSRFYVVLPMRYAPGAARDSHAR